MIHCALFDHVVLSDPGTRRSNALLAASIELTRDSALNQPFPSTGSPFLPARVNQAVMVWHGARMSGSDALGALTSMLALDQRSPLSSTAQVRRYAEHLEARLDERLRAPSVLFLARHRSADPRYWECMFAPFVRGASAGLHVLLAPMPVALVAMGDGDILVPEISSVHPLDVLETAAGLWSDGGSYPGLIDALSAAERI